MGAVSTHDHELTGAADKAEGCPLFQRALDLWPRLDGRALARCGCDSRRIARYVSRRTSLSVEAIQDLLERAWISGREDASLWFG